MKPWLILMSHGNFAQEAYESAKCIAGESDSLLTLCMSMEDGGDGIRTKLDVALNCIPASAGVVIITDINGGTPCNVAIEKMMRRDNTRILTGLNLDMVIEYVVSPISDIDELCDAIRVAGTEAVEIIHITKSETAGEINQGVGYED